VEGPRPSYARAAAVSACPEILWALPFVTIHRSPSAHFHAAAGSINTQNRRAGSGKHDNARVAPQCRRVRDHHIAMNQAALESQFPKECEHRFRAIAVIVDSGQTGGKAGHILPAKIRQPQRLFQQFG
jgi:hypothetical protein